MLHYLFDSNSSNKKAERLLCHQVLESNNEYYRFLSKKNKTHFVNRVLYFVSNIKMDSTEEIELNQQKKYLIASAFIQITFGLKRHRLKSFNTVFVVHKAYTYKSIGVPYHGDTNPNTGKINLVWKVVKKGFDIPHDSLNLAIHEFAHAIALDNRKRSPFRRFFSHKKFMQYLMASKNEMHKIRNGETSIFRDYGATNLMEFFAVSVEVFFEQSNLFATKNPQLFKHLSSLLKQDPRLVENPSIL